MNKVVNIVNFKQVCKYIEHGVKPIDIYYTNRLVFVFDKNRQRNYLKSRENMNYK